MSDEKFQEWDDVHRDVECADWRDRALAAEDKVRRWEEAVQKFRATCHPEDEDIVMVGGVEVHCDDVASGVAHRINAGVVSYFAPLMEPSDE